MAIGQQGRQHLQNEVTKPHPTIRKQIKLNKTKANSTQPNLTLPNVTQTKFVRSAI